MSSIPNASGSAVPAHEIVYQGLRNRVLFGEYAPGQAITIQGAALALGAGLTPVREAIRRLTSEGALEFLDNRRIIVPVLSRQALDELLYARCALEPELARRAAERADAALVEEMTRLDAALDRAIELGDVRGYLEMNHEFHDALYSRADAPILKAVVGGLWLRFGPSLRVVCGRSGTGSLPDMHKALIEAVRRGDPEAAAAAVRADIEQGMQQVLTTLGQLVDGSPGI